MVIIDPKHEYIHPNCKKKNTDQWRKAISAMLRRLIQNPDATKVFIIIEALAGNALDKGFQRFRATAMGQQILAEKRSLLDSLRDREQLAAQPKHSLAAHYLNFVTRGRDQRRRFG